MPTGWGYSKNNVYAGNPTILLDIKTIITRFRVIPADIHKRVTGSFAARFNECQKQHDAHIEHILWMSEETWYTYWTHLMNVRRNTMNILSTSYECQKKHDTHTEHILRMSEETWCTYWTHLMNVRRNMMHILNTSYECQKKHDAHIEHIYECQKKHDAHIEHILWMSKKRL